MTEKDLQIQELRAEVARLNSALTQAHAKITNLNNNLILAQLRIDELLTIMGVIENEEATKPVPNVQRS